MKDNGNFAESIHNEEYYKPFNLRNIGWESGIFTGGRDSEKLNGKWHYVHDLYDVGFRDSWTKAKAEREDSLTEPWDFHPEEGPVVQLPSCWNTNDPRLFYFEGTVWYSRRFLYKKKYDGERVFLRIGAANYDTKIFLNNTFLGNHVGGSTPFFVELTDTLELDNSLIISVNNVRSSNLVPMKNTDWMNWGGLYRDIELIRVPKVYIKNFEINLVPDGHFNKIRVRCSLSDKAEIRADFKIPELNIHKIIELEEGKADFIFEATPELWDPDNPKLYGITLETADDKVEDSVGFREIKIDGTDLVLNGKKIFLRGISVHEDDARNGKMLSDDDLKQRFADARELNANCMRFAHYPHDQRAVQMADREGFLIWAEIPVYWAIDFDNSETYKDAENQLAELINRDFNRASVIIWSVGNENLDTDSRLTFMKNLTEKAREMDSTRMISAACLVNSREKKIEDRLAEYLDIIGLNEYYGWYAPDFNELNVLLKNSAPKKPVLISEFGAGAKAGHHSTKEDMFSEEHMDSVYEQQIEVIRNQKYICGITPWILYDFTCPRRQNKYQQGYNRKGLIAEDKRTRKMAFYRLKNFYNERNLEG